MSFKLKGAPYDKDNMNIAIYRKDLTDGSAGKSNHTGIIIDKDVSPEMEKAVIAHEKVHQKQQKKGELDYDENNFYWKGKVYPRENLNEHNENLPWEKDAYKESNKILNGKQKDQMKQRFQLKGYRGNNKAFKNLTSKSLIGASMNGDPLGKSDRKMKKERNKYGCLNGVCAAPNNDSKKDKFKDDSGGGKRRRGTIETSKYEKFKKDPAMEVAVNQFNAQGQTGFRESKGKSVKDFKKEVERTNIFKSDIGDRAAKMISRPKEVRTDKQTIKTRRNNKGKAKVSVKRSYDYEGGKKQVQTTPYDMTVTKDRLVGRDKVRRYTTEPSRAQDNKARFKAGEIGGNKRSVVDVKLVSKDKMRKLSKKAAKQLSKGNPIPVKKKTPNKSVAPNRMF